MMFQSYALWPHMTVAGNIGYGLRMRGWKSDAIAARVGRDAEAPAARRLHASGPVTQLSGGQRQRVALGRALAVDPHLLLLDEPMSNLDYKVRLELRHELRALQRRIGITAVYVTHDREEALTLADRIAVIDAGRIVQIGAPEEIFHRPESAFVAGFMGADNALDLIAHRRRRAGGAVAGTPAAERLRAHFRSDAATLAQRSVRPCGRRAGAGGRRRAIGVCRPWLSLPRAHRRRRSMGPSPGARRGRDGGDRRRSARGAPAVSK